MDILMNAEINRDLFSRSRNVTAHSQLNVTAKQNDLSSGSKYIKRFVAYC